MVCDKQVNIDWLLIENALAKLVGINLAPVVPLELLAKQKPLFGQVDDTVSSRPADELLAETNIKKSWNLISQVIKLLCKTRMFLC